MVFFNNSKRVEERFPILIKATTMKYSWWKLFKLIKRNFKQALIRRLQTKKYSFLTQWRYCINFDITEDFIWWQSDKNVDLLYNDQTYKEILNSLIV